MWDLQGIVREGDEDVKNAAEIAMDCAEMEGGKGCVTVSCVYCNVLTDSNGLCPTVHTVIQCICESKLNRRRFCLPT